MLENQQGYMLTLPTMLWFWDNYLQSPEDAENPFVCPLRAPDHANLPPAIVATAEFDPLRDDGERYAAKLKEAGVPVTLTRYDGMIHGFFWTSGVVAGSRRLIDDVGRHVRAVLADASPAASGPPERAAAI